VKLKSTFVGAHNALDTVDGVVLQIRWGCLVSGSARKRSKVARRLGGCNAVESCLVDAALRHKVKSCGNGSG
jgi:hypothetical protein